MTVDSPDKLVQRARFDELSNQSRAAFDDYLRLQGLDPDTINEDEAEKILVAA